MTSLRDHVAALDEAGALLTIEEEVHWTTDLPTIAAEAARKNGPALCFENVSERTRVVSGVYGGPDQMQPRSVEPWSRTAQALDIDDEYTALVQHIAQADPSQSSLREAELEAEPRDDDLFALGFPDLGDSNTPTITLGLLAISTDGEPTWAPVRANVTRGDRLEIVVPDGLARSLSAGNLVTIALGVPLASLVAATLQWTGDTSFSHAIANANALDEFPLATTEGGLIPASSELILKGTVTDSNVKRGNGPVESWEHATSTTTIAVRVSSIASREDPIVPISPLGAPLADDVHLLSLVESARLLRRVNHYWGVEPVKWVSLPAETKLGVCLISSEILYAGFEWQLANTLFSFSRLFDKVIVLDEDTPPANLARAFDDIWVKAHPSHDWQFSDPSAPTATVTRYRQDGETGSRLYIDATWDPRWNDEYIAPRVGFETSFPNDVREFVTEQWSEMGFSNSLE
ncbi:UbiD family decarboxylase [Halegenticoccus tardaugens]|uniref:UbiD family decarboxylase n=1 Tax=Halegenticoccus tardaugens TaxID=2071624 RepID=UPI00100A4358|nr:UbiD family decarboxylase [Halegenticoccus tardaugens]